MPNAKRILSVRVIREIDSDPDTSYLGEYGDTRESEYSIDRAHSEDCASLESNHRVAVDTLERILSHVFEWRRNAGNDDNAQQGLDEACDILVGLQDDAMECDCSVDIGCREFRYFNPSFNYVYKAGRALPENTPDEVRKYVRQDYERMERYNAGDWCYFGIRAECEYQTGISDIVQKLHSGGLWGIESDSDTSYFAEVEQDELSALRTELKALGFSTRAISTAFKNVEHKER